MHFGTRVQVGSNARKASQSRHERRSLQLFSWISRLPPGNPRQSQNRHGKHRCSLCCHARHQGNPPLQTFSPSGYSFFFFLSYSIGFFVCFSWSTFLALFCFCFCAFWDLSVISHMGFCLLYSVLFNCMISHSCRHIVCWIKQIRFELLFHNLWCLIFLQVFTMSPVIHFLCKGPQSHYLCFFYTFKTVYGLFDNI